jgi:hypothetical protein
MSATCLLCSRPSARQSPEVVRAPEYRYGIRAVWIRLCAACAQLHGRWNRIPVAARFLALAEAEGIPPSGSCVPDPELTRAVAWRQRRAIESN